MKRYQLGLIGYGGFGQFLYNTWAKSELVDVIAIADKKGGNNIPASVNFYNNWVDLLKNPNIEIVSIATPPASHAEITCTALKMEKHVLLEKPMATTLSDAQKIIRTHKNTDPVLMVDYMLRFHPLVEILKTWTESNLFGHLRRVVVENYAQDELLPKNHWFWDQTQSGGILVEHAVHFIDLVNYLSNSTPKRINGISNWRNQHQEDQVLVNVLYNNGLIATHYHDFSRPGFFENTNLLFVFDLAQISLHGWIPTTGHFTVLVKSKAIKELEKLPQLEIKQNSLIGDFDDLSRPNGWGCTGASLFNKTGEVHSGGKTYQVDNLMSGKFALNKTKTEIYKDLLNSLLLDLITTIRNPSHCPRITPKDGYTSLRMAIQGKRGLTTGISTILL